LISLEEYGIMKMLELPKKVLITGSAGLIGSEAAKFFAQKGFEVHGIDNDMRKYFFGKEASTKCHATG